MALASWLAPTVAGQSGGPMPLASDSAAQPLLILGMGRWRVREPDCDRGDGVTADPSRLPHLIATVSVTPAIATAAGGLMRERRVAAPVGYTGDDARPELSVPKHVRPKVAALTADLGQSQPGCPGTPHSLDESPSGASVAFDGLGV